MRGRIALSQVPYGPAQVLSLCRGADPPHFLDGMKHSQNFSPQ